MKMHDFNTKRTCCWKGNSFSCENKKACPSRKCVVFFNCASHPGFWHGSPRDYSEQICDACKHPLACLNKNNEIEKLNKGSERDGSFLTTVSAMLRRGAPEERCLCPLFRIILKDWKRERFLSAIFFKRSNFSYAIKIIFRRKKNGL